MLVIAVGFNLWLYRLEPTALTDPNDNTFQFALVDRTNQIWDFAHQKCSSNILTYPACFAGYMVDHWVPNWAEGYSLPFFYTHVPQIIIVALFRLLSVISIVSLYGLYKWITYFLLCLFPISVFAALRIAGFSWIAAGIGSLMASHISTDGLYGLDPPSFLWRGYGLSSQLFAMIWLPIATAYGYRFFRARTPRDGFHILRVITEEARLYFSPALLLISKRSGRLSQEQQTQRRLFWKTVIFSVLTISGHLGVGIMAMMSLGFLSVAKPITATLLKQPIKEILRIFVDQMIALALVGVTTVFFMGYFIIPTLVYNDYHNISFWDPIWKFDSYGWIEVMNALFNGDLYDFGRFPVMTLLVLIGVYVAFTYRNRSETSKEASNGQPEMKQEDTYETYPYASFAYLFVFWLVFYFGRTTWGGLIDLIPGMSEVHLSRFIVGLHLAGLFLIPLAISWIVTRGSRLLLAVARKWWNISHIPSELRTGVHATIWTLTLLIMVPPVYKQTIVYNDLNNALIRQANDNYMAIRGDVDGLFDTIRSLPPGRVFAGRGGGWGKDFEVAETPYYMMLSTYGVPTVLWMPQTWSPNSDIEQYFSEGNPDHFDLYNIRYIAAPASQQSDAFWQYRTEMPTWKLYEVPTNGYFMTGTETMTVSVEKETYKNIIHTWTQSELSEKRQFPVLTFDRHPQSSLPVISMTDEVTYETQDGSMKNIFADWPLIASVEPQANVVGPERVDTDMIYATKVEVPENCPHCLLILKQTSHPNWRVTIDGAPVKHVTVFPFFTAIRLTEPGTHEVVFEYKPNTLKMTLFLLATVAAVLLIAGAIKEKRTTSSR